MRISDWSSDVCSSDLITTPAAVPPLGVAMNLLNYSGRAMLPMIRQSEAAECGLACLAMVASYHGHPTTLGMLRRRLTVSLTGLSLADLIDMADEIGLAARPLRAELDEIELIRDRKSTRLIYSN